MRRVSKHLSLLLLATALAACGGGGGGYGSNPPPASSITIAGTGAKGAALAGGTVNVKCASGTATATTASSGAYSVTITGGTLPCVIKLTGTAGEVFHSVVPGTGTSGTFTANVTPLTEMVVAQLAGASPAAYFTGFGNGSTVGSTALAQAITYVKSAVASVTDLGTINPVTDALAVGDTQDQKIDAVMAALAAANVTLSSVTAAIAANPQVPTVIAGAVAPAAADCPWLKSGRYRALSFYDSVVDRFATINATALTGTDPDGQAIVLIPDGNCQYTIDGVGSTTRLIVSSSGVMVVFGQSKTVATDRQLALAFPEQAHPVSDLGGTWSAASWEPAAAGPAAQYFATMAEITFDATGQATALSNCVGLATCVPRTPPLSRFVVNATNGGFDEILPNGSLYSRAFVFKTLSGATAMFVVTPDLQFIVGTRKQPIPLPAVNNVTAYREVELNGNRSIDALIEDSITVNSVDATAKTATRTRLSDGRIDTLAYDSPRPGLRYRQQNSCRNGAGATINCAEVVNLQIQGMGWRIATSVGSNTAAAFYNINVNKP
jgi:hypothetical protein